MIWVSPTAVNADRLRSELTLHTTPFRGEPETIRLYAHRGGKLGVPRAWGLKHLKLSEFDLNVTTSLPVEPDWPKITFPEGWDYWPGQKESVEAVERAITGGSDEFGGLLEAACGTGKTLMGLDIASRLETPTLVVVHKSDLADQWRLTALGGRKDGKDVPGLFPGCRFGHVQGDQWDFENCHVVTALAQTLYSRRDDIPREFWESFGCTIFDEGHRYPARTFEQVLRSSTSHVRLGVSATWRRKDGLECVWHWHVGRVLHRTRAERLTGRFKQIPWNTQARDWMFKWKGLAGMLNAIAENAPYAEWLADQLVSARGADRRVLLVSDRISQLTDIRTRLLKRGETSVGLYVSSLPTGDTTKSGKPKMRKVSNEELHDAKECSIVLATYGMMAEGTDIPSLDTLVLGTPRSDIEQVVGRIQRYAKKKTLVIVDPVFSLGLCKNMAKKRKAEYERLGFVNQDDLK